jgi:hypothetical protein
MSSDPPHEPPRLPGAPPVANSELASAVSTSNRPLLLGLGIGFALYLAVLGFTVLADSDSQGYWTIGLVVWVAMLSVLMFVAGLVLTIIERTRKFGIGLLISIGAGLLVDGGACVALLARG